VFSQSKVLYTIGANSFEDTLGSDFVKLAKISAVIKEKDMDVFKEGSNASLMRGGAQFADAVSVGSDQVDAALVDEFSKVKGKRILHFNPESDLTDYLQMYSDLAK
jgi:starch synthase